MRPFPEVLILGAMRAGTTFLHHALSAHPGVAAPRAKELQFFSYGWGNGPDCYRRQLPRRAPAWAYPLLGRRRPITIDSSPYYLFHPEAPARARTLLGAAPRMIVLLREPGARAWSHYRHSLRRGIEHLGFLDAIEKEQDRLAGEAERIATGHERADAPHQTFSYLARGRYAEQLRRWWEHFPRERFLLMRSDDLFADPQAAFDRVCDFLDLARMPLSGDLPRNALAPDPMPDAVRRRLDDLFAAPNAELAELTGLHFPARLG